MQVWAHCPSCTNLCAAGTLLLDCAANIWIVLTHATAMMPRANRLGPSRFHKPWRSSCRAMDKDIAPSRYNTLERRRRKINHMVQYCAAPQTLSTSQLPKQTRGQDSVKNGDKSFAGTSQNFCSDWWWASHWEMICRVPLRAPYFTFCFAPVSCFSASRALLHTAGSTVASQQGWSRSVSQQKIKLNNKNECVNVP